MQPEEELSLLQLKKLMRLFKQHKPEPLHHAKPGRMNLNEFNKAINKAWPERDLTSEIEVLFRKVDLSSDGLVDWEEFSSYILLRLQERELSRSSSSSKVFQSPPRMVKIQKSKVTEIGAKTNRSSECQKQLGDVVTYQVELLWFIINYLYLWFLRNQLHVFLLLQIRQDIYLWATWVSRIFLVEIICTSLLFDISRFTDEENAYKLVKPCPIMTLTSKTLWEKWLLNNFIRRDKKYVAFRRMHCSL